VAAREGKPVMVRTAEKGRAWRSKVAKVAVAVRDDATTLCRLLLDTRGDGIPKAFSPA
jgi:hypothetical protein